jgi:hypothetical protein
VGPGYTLAHGEPVLSNGMGGMSGKGVLPIALKCIRDVRAVSGAADHRLRRPSPAPPTWTRPWRPAPTWSASARH